MPKEWIDVDQVKDSLTAFLQVERDSVFTFGSTVNQVFEAFVFAVLVDWYKAKGWRITIRHPGKPKAGEKATLKLKFSTNGRPENYSFAECVKGRKRIHVRHQLRVATAWHTEGDTPAANVFLDVAVLKPTDVKKLTTRDAVPNANLITFGEAKHMSAFAELIAGFEGLVHEMQPQRLTDIRNASGLRKAEHPAPFLYVSGGLNPSAEGMQVTIKRRGYDVDVYTSAKGLSDGIKLPKTKPVKKSIPTVGTTKSGMRSDPIPVDDLPF